MEKYGYIVAMTNGDIVVVESDKEEFENIEFHNWIGDDAFLEFFQVNLPMPLYCVCDDNGHLKELYVNPIATKMYGLKDDYIVGDVVIGEIDIYAHDIKKFEINDAYTIADKLKQFMGWNT